MQRKNIWKGAAAVLAAVLMTAGCAAGGGDAVKTAEVSVPGTVEQSSGQETTAAPQQQSRETEPAGESQAPDLSKAAACTGRYLRTKNGGNMVVLDRDGPVSFQSTEREPRFADFDSGDKVVVWLEFIQETYPGQSEALDIRLLEKGSLDDVDADTLTTLTDMGWLVPEQKEDWQVMLGGVVLRCTGRAAKVKCGTADGTLTSCVAVNQTPKEDGQSNFGCRDIEYIRLDESAAAVKLEGSYVLFLADGTVEYEGDFFAADQLSQETLDWLERYNSMPEEAQRSTSMVPPDLIVNRGTDRAVAEETAEAAAKD